MGVKIIVDPRTLNAAQKCRKECSCLSKEEGDMCEVVFCVNNKLMGIELKAGPGCSYRISEDERHYCICPVRKEIYNKYHI